MEKYKTIILIEKIRKYLEEGNRKEALSIADSIDKKKLKNMTDLSIVAESYFQNGDYDQARGLYQRIYQKTRSRRIVAQLVHLSIKLNEIEEANQYLAEFIQIAPQDFYQHIFRFSIDKLKKAPLAKLIEDLVALKNMEYIENWAYELAKLYHKAGMKEACIAECDDIILWFGNGEYVERAKALRAYYKGELKIDENDSKELTNASLEELQEPSQISMRERDKELDKETDKETDKERDKELNQPITGEFDTQAEDINEEELELLENALAKEVCSTFLEKEEIWNRKSDTSKIEEADLRTDRLDTNASETKAEDEIRSEDEQTEATDIESEDEQTEATNIESEEERTEVADIKSEDEKVEAAVIKAAEEEAQIEVAEINLAITQDTLEEQVEAELYRLLKEEEKEISKSENKDEIIQQKSNEDAIAYEEQDVETKFISKEKVVQKKINLKILSNEQLVGEDQEELIQELIKNQISLLDTFGNFMRMEPVRKQLVRSLDQILTQRSINVIITGEAQSGKTRLAKCIAKLLFRMKLIHTNKVALVDGEKLNSKNLMSKKEQLRDCVVIIEHSGMMSKETVKTLLDLSAVYHNNIAIILEDTREKINRLLRSNSQLNSIFNNRIHLHKYTMEDYMGFAYDYITEQDYEIEMDAFIALQNEFAVFMHKKRENALKAILSYLDSIIVKSEKRSAEQLKKIAQTGHFANTDLMVLKKEDIKS